MIPEIILALAAGIAAGTFTGLFPGIHINLIAALLLASFSAALLEFFPPIALAVFIAALATTHSFLDFIPSIFLGAPDEDNFLSILPGHQLLQRGQGNKAALLTLYGSLLAIPIILLFTPVFIYLFPYLFGLTKTLIPYLLIFASFFLIFREKHITTSLIIFFLAGFLGFASLNLPIKQPLLPLLTGLFGLSSLILSIKNKFSIPSQSIIPLNKIKIPKKQTAKTALAASLAAPISSFLPGMGSGHAAIIGSEIFEHDAESFLFLLGAINTIVVALSFISLYSMGKTRTGAAAAVKEILKTLSASDLTVIIGAILLSSIAAFFIGLWISKLVAKNIHRINYQTLSLSIISILLILNFLLTNYLGILVLFTATSLGLFTMLSQVRRINLMGALLIPTIIFYLTV